MKPAILVTDGDQRAALAIVRSLGRAGYRVFVCSPRRRSLAGASRHCRAEATVPEALRDPSGFVEAVGRLTESWNIGVLLPVTEASLLALLPARERFPKACIPFPDAGMFERVSDKAALLEIAASLGIPVPAQAVLRRRTDLSKLGLDQLRFPLVLKPYRSVAGEGEGEQSRVKLGVRYAADPSQLAAVVAGLPSGAFPLLLQQRLVGPGQGVFLLRWGGATRAVFAHRRIREKPPSGGVSVCAESVPADPGLVSQAERLLRHFGWQGVAMVEFKLDAATGTAYLMEVNGRFWGSLQLAIDAGVDFPRLLVSAALGDPPEPVSGYRIGVRTRWWWGEVDHLLARLRRSDTDLALAPGTPGRWRALAEFLASSWHPGTRNEVLRRDDPRPFFQETTDWLRGR